MSQINRAQGLKRVEGFRDLNPSTRPNPWKATRLYKLHLHRFEVAVRAFIEQCECERDKPNRGRSRTDFWRRNQR